MSGSGVRDPGSARAAVPLKPDTTHVLEVRMKPLELTIYPKREWPMTGAEIMPYREQWQREAALKQTKHLADAELAAEYHHQRERFYTVHEGYSVTSEGTRLVSPDVEWRRMDTLRRFATLPHHDEVQP